MTCGVDAFALQVARAMSPKASGPILEMKVTAPPRRAAATDWFEPLPPGPILKPEPAMVSPIAGMPPGAEGEIGDEDAEDGDAASCAMRLNASSGGMTPFLKTKQP